MIYIDTSAFLKLITEEEAEAAALRGYLDDLGTPQFVSSTLLTVEARRGTIRASPGRLPRVDVMLADVAKIAISDAVMESASRLKGRMLRSLDAIHLATVLLIRDDVDVLLTYDQRLLDTAEAHQIPTAAPA